MRNHNTQEYLPIPGSIAEEGTAVFEDTSDLFYVRSSSNIYEANITYSQKQRGSIKAATLKGLSQNCVFVLDTHRTPITPARDKQLLKTGNAAILRKFPFTIILKKTVEKQPDQVEAKIAPGAKTTGIYVVPKKQNRVLFVMNLVHRWQQIKGSLLSIRQIRRSRKNCKTPYRKSRFGNGRKASGWLPPSLEHRLQTTMIWITRFPRFSPIESSAVAKVKFETEQIENPEISGIEYQQGNLWGYEVQEYLKKWARKWAYCGVENVPFEIESLDGCSKRYEKCTLSEAS